MQDDKLVTDVTDSAVGKTVENENENGVTYSADGKMLLNAPCGLKTCVVKPGTEVITSDAFANERYDHDDYFLNNNEQLEEVVLPNTLEIIGYEAFIGCICLKTIELPDSVTWIDGRAFYGCMGLTEIVIPKSVTKISEDAFSGCSGLEKIVVEEGNPRYDSRGGCNAIIDSETNELIVGCKNTVIPDTVTKIGNGSFSGCTGLIEVEIPNSVTEIDGGAFRNCTGLTEIDIPSSVTEIGNYAFDGCSGLEKIVVEDGNPSYDSRGDCNAIIDSETDELILGCKNTIIPDTVTKIGDWAFRGCTGLAEIVIPKSVTAFSVMFGDQTFFGAETFYGCSGLEKIVVEDGNPRYDSRCSCNAVIDSETDELILGCKNTIIPDTVTKIGDIAFRGCTGLTEIVIPNSVKEIGDQAFDGCTGLKEIVIPDSVTEIECRVFHYCTGLREIVIPKSVTKIGELAFGGCRDLEKIVVEDGNPSYDSRGDCNAIIDSKTNELILACKNTIIPDTVTKIGDWAFSSCKGLEEIVVPNLVMEIAPNAFADCEALAKIEVLAKDPPKCLLDCRYEIFIDGVDKSKCELVVPAGSLEAYKGADGWKDFLKVTAGVEGVGSDKDGVAVTAHDGEITINGVAASDAVVEVYGMNGTLVYRGKSRSISVPGAGIYAVHVAGKTVKVAVK